MREYVGFKKTGRIEKKKSKFVVWETFKIYIDISDILDIRFVEVIEISEMFQNWGKIWKLVNILVVFESALERKVY